MTVDTKPVLCYNAQDITNKGDNVKIWVNKEEYTGIKAEAIVRALLERDALLGAAAMLATDNETRQAEIDRLNADIERFKLAWFGRTANGYELSEILNSIQPTVIESAAEDTD